MGRNRAMHPEGKPLSRWSLAFWVAVLVLGWWTKGGVLRPTEFETSAAGLAISGDDGVNSPAPGGPQGEGRRGWISRVR